MRPFLFFVRMAELPDEFSKLFHWDRVRRLPGPSRQDGAQWKAALELAKDRVQKEELTVRGHKTVDFVTFGALKGPLSSPLQHELGEVQTGILGCMMRSRPLLPEPFEWLRPETWSFFASHLPSLRKNPEQAYGAVLLHADDSDYRSKMNQEMDSKPAVLWSPPSLLQLGTRVLVPFAWEDTGRSEIPALAAARIFQEDIPNNPFAPALFRGLEEQHFRFFNLQPGPLYFVGAPVIHSRMPLPEPAHEAEGWRYNFRLNFVFRPY